MAEHMTANERILSYLKNRKGVPVPPSAVAVGARMKSGTVGTQLAKLIDAGQVIRVADQFPLPHGRSVHGVVHADYRDLVADKIVMRKKPMPYRALKLCADALEKAANRFLTDVPESDDMDMHGLRVARDMYRDLKDRGILPSDSKTSRAG